MTCIIDIYVMICIYIYIMNIHNTYNYNYIYIYIYLPVVYTYMHRHPYICDFSKPLDACRMITRKNRSMIEWTWQQAGVGSFDFGCDLGFDLQFTGFIRWAKGKPCESVMPLRQSQKRGEETNWSIATTPYLCPLSAYLLKYSNPCVGLTFFQQQTLNL